MRQSALALLILVTCLVAPATTAADLDEILAMNYEARGGLEAIKSIQSLRMTGKTLAMGQVEAPILIEMKRLNKMRIEFTVQGMTGVQGYDGETAWMIMPFMGKPDPEPMPDAQAKELVDQADMDGILVDWQEKGHTVELLGTEDVEGTETYKLKVTRASGDEVFVYLDSEYGIEIMQSATRTVPGQGAEMEFVTYFSDYKEVAGVMMPHSMETRVGEQSLSNITVSEIEVNVDIPDDRFTMPEPTTTPSDEEAQP